jgi:hypothetical protein
METPGSLPILAKTGNGEPDPATGNHPPGLSSMAGFALGAQIRREVFGELENLPRLSPENQVTWVI